MVRTAHLFEFPDFYPNQGKLGIGKLEPAPTLWLERSRTLWISPPSLARTSFGGHLIF